MKNRKLLGWLNSKTELGFMPCSVLPYGVKKLIINFLQFIRHFF